MHHFRQLQAAPADGRCILAPLRKRCPRCWLIRCSRNSTFSRDIGQHRGGTTGRTESQASQGGDCSGNQCLGCGSSRRFLSRSSAVGKQVRVPVNPDNCARLRPGGRGMLNTGTRLRVSRPRLAVMHVGLLSRFSVASLMGRARNCMNCASHYRTRQPCALLLHLQRAPLLPFCLSRFRTTVSWERRFRLVSLGVFVCPAFRYPRCCKEYDSCELCFFYA